MTITKIKRIGQKSAWIETHEPGDDRQPVKVLKSYATRVAFAAGLDGYISERYNSRTTSQHISYFTREYPGVTWHELEPGEFFRKLWEATD
jgi:hypothetical protein